MNIVQGAKPASLPPLPAELIAKFRAIVGDKYAVTDAADIAPYVTEERELFHGRSPLVLRPGSTAEVSAICKLASEHRIALVPQGGNTGLVGGQTPHHGEVVVSLRRLDKIREIDAASNTMTCEAGVVLQIAQAARGRGRPPVSAVARRGRKLHHRRQPLHQCRRHRGAGLWRRARDGARARSGARGRPHPERTVEAEKGQYRLRSAQPVHRRRRHARHHHRGDAKAVSETARGGDRLCRPQIAGGGAEAAVDLAERGGQQPHQLRTAGRYRGRFQPASRHRHPRSADEQASLVRADGVVVVARRRPRRAGIDPRPRAWRKASSTTP